MKHMESYDLDDLVRRYRQYRRIRNQWRRHATFAQYTECPDYCDRVALARLRDWRDNPRLALGRYPILLN